MNKRTLGIFFCLIICASLFTTFQYGRNSVPEQFEQKISGQHEQVNLAFNKQSAREAQLVRLYLAYFRRQPDASGFGYWSEQLNNGISLDHVSQEFSKSKEFLDRYQKLDNQEFVTLVYKNVLDRSPDQEGLNFWVSELDSNLSRGALMTSFSESVEFIKLTKTTPPRYQFAGEIERLYLGFFQRKPNPTDLDYWLIERERGISVIEVAEVFSKSYEFKKTYGFASNSEFVALVYKNVLGRSPDVTGQIYWTSLLGSGLSRGSLMVKFTESSENINTGNLTSVQKRGLSALENISYPWQELLPEWSIDFKPSRKGYLGLTEVGAQQIIIYVRPGQSEMSISHVLAHEMGHAVDVSLNSQDDRLAWQNARKINGRPWWPSNAASDYATGAGDFAESFAVWQVGPTYYQGQIASSPSSSQIKLLKELAFD